MANDRFQLEALEPRLLLSADPMAEAAWTALETSDTAILVAVEAVETEADEIFGTIEDLAPPTAVDAELEEDDTTTVVLSPLDADSADTGRADVQIGLADQLVATLNAANGPPVQGGPRASSANMATLSADISVPVAGTLAVSDLTITITNFGTLSGDFVFEQDGGNIEAVSSNVTAIIDNGSFSAGVTSGTLALQWTDGSNFAFSASGTASLVGGDLTSVSATVDGTIAYNNTGSDIDTTVTVDTDSAGLSVTDGTALVALDDLSVTIADFASLTGDFAFETDGTELTAVASSATATISSGGSSAGFSAGELALVLDASDNHVLYGSGTAELTVSGAAISGTLVVQDNNTGATFTDNSVSVNGTSVSIDEDLADGATLFSGTSVSITVTDFVTITADIGIELRTTTIEVAGSNVSADLQTGDLAVGLTATEFAAIFNDDGTVAYATGSLVLTAGDLSTTANATMSFNNRVGDFSADNVTIDTIDVDIPGITAGTTRFEATGDVTFSSGETISGTLVLRAETSVEGETVVTAAATGVSIDFSASSSIVTVTGGSGVFVLTSAGIYGEATATVAVTHADISVSGTFSAALNSTSSQGTATITAGGAEQTIDVPAGPYVRVSAEGASLTYTPASGSAQTLTGNFTLEASTDIDDGAVVALSAYEVTMPLQTDGTNVVDVSNGSGVFIIHDDGIAGSLSATVAASSGMDFELEGRFSLELNSLDAAVDLSAEFASGTFDVSLAAGPFLRLAGDDVVVRMLDESLSGNFALEATDSEIELSASNVSTTISAGNVRLTAEGGAGTFLITADGIAGVATLTSMSLSGASDVSVSASAIELQIRSIDTPAALMLDIDTDGDGSDESVTLEAGAYVAISASLDLTVLDQTFSGTFAIQVDTQEGAEVMTL